MAKHHQKQEHDAGPDDPMPQPPAGAGRPGRIRLGLLPTWTASWQARRALEQLDLPADLAHTGALLVSELVTHSVRHARLAPGELIRLRADWSGTHLRVHVHDGGRRGRRPAASGSAGPTPKAEPEWGLYVVDRLASRWGLDTGGYWFELHHSPPS